MFAPFMINAWVAGTVVAVVAGVVGFFVVVRGSSFLAHSVPHGAFAGAAGAVMLGIDPLVGIAVFSAAGAVTIAALGRRARADVATALGLSMMLGAGALFLSRSSEYSAEVFSLLFGQVLGVATVELVPLAVLAGVCLAATAVLYRPLLTASALPGLARGRGVDPQLMSVVFGLIIAVATTTSVPIVGALLMFALLVGPPAAACLLTARPGRAMALSVLFAVATVWVSIWLAYRTDWPVGFFVAGATAVLYTVAASWRRLRWRRPLPRAGRGGLGLGSDPAR